VIEFLDYIISADSITMTERNVQEVQNWSRPHKVKDIQEFLGFVNFYRQFIKRFSKTAYSLTELTKKDHQWNWMPKCQQVFNKCKKNFITTLIVVHFHFKQEMILETDASDYALEAILFSRQLKKKIYSCAFLSWKFSPPEMNYDIHDKEMSAIIQSFKEWEPSLKLSQH